MRSMRIVSAAAAILAVTAATAHAGTTFTVGSGDNPHVLVDPASGAGHFVWANYATDDVLYCQVPRGATACAVSRTLHWALGGDPGAPWLVRDPVTGFLHIVFQRFNDTFQWTSNDGGTSWAGPAKIYAQSGNGAGGAEPYYGPQPGQILFSSTNPDRYVFSAAADGSEAVTGTTFATPPGGDLFDFEAAPTSDNGAVAVSQGGGTMYSYRLPAGGDPSVDAQWGAAAPIGAGDTTTVGGGAAGTYLVAHTSGRVEARRWNTVSGAWNAPVVIEQVTGYLPDVAVSPAGGVAVVYRRNDLPHRLQFALSTDGGATFSTPVALHREFSVFFDLDVSIADDNKGFAVWEESDTIFATSTDGLPETVVTPVTTPPATPPAPRPAPPAATPSPTKSTTVTSNGAVITFSVPRGCVAPGSSFRVTLSWRKQRRKGNLFVKITRTDFYIGTRRVKIDRKVPFRQTLSITNARRGATYTLRARAFIKVKRGRQPKKSIRNTVKVCA